VPSTPQNSVSRSSANGRSRKADFSRPELTTPWQKFSSNIVVRVVAAVLLVGGTGALTWAAVSSTL
jgi:hypothetical protein